MNKQDIIVLLGVMLIISLSFMILIDKASAQSQLFYKQNSEIDLKVPCFNNGTSCSASAICNITIYYPNSTILINNAQMTNSVSYHNYTLLSNETAILGDYQSIMICNDGSLNGHSTFSFTITPTGIENNISLIAIAIIMLGSIVILSYLSFKISEN
jgi:hypothetical protein